MMCRYNTNIGTVGAYCIRPQLTGSVVIKNKGVRKQ